MSEHTVPVHQTEAESSNYRRRVLTAVGIFLGIITLGLLIFGTASALLLLFIGLLIAVGLRTMSHWLYEHTPLPELPALAVVVSAILLVLVILGLLIGPSLVTQVDQLVQQLPTSLDQIEEMLSQMEVGRWVLDSIPEDPQLTEFLQGENTNVFGRITGIVSTSVSALGNLVLLLFTALFLAIEPRTYMDGIALLFPPSYRARSKEIMLEVGHTLADWLKTRFLSMIAITIMTTVGLMFINMPLELSLGIIAGLMAFIPLVGPLIAVIPAALVGLLQSPQTALWVVVVYIVVQSIDNYIITPIIVKRTIRMPPALIILAQLTLGVLFGRIGLVVAAPLAAVGMRLTQLAYVQDFLNRGTPEEYEQA